MTEIESKSLQKYDQETGAEITSPLRPEPLVVTEQYIDQQKQSLALLQKAVKEVLIYGRDYGRVPGTPDFLWDPGASQINGFFNVFPGHRRLLHLVDDGEQISVIVEVPLIQRNTGAEVGSGVAGSSTREVKHKYRWEPDPENWGYGEEEIATLKTRDKDGVLEYRIKNPEHAELLNVIVKQASKRAEVDGVNSLPGVASALKELISGGRKRESSDETQNEESGDIPGTSPKWTKFWGEVKALGITKEDGQVDAEKAHKMLGVKSMKDWLAAGKTLDQATKQLAKKVKEQEAVDAAGEDEGKLANKMAWGDIVIGDVDTYDKLEDVWGKITGRPVKDMYKELGVDSRRDISISSVEAFHQLKIVFAPEPIKES